MVETLSEVECPGGGVHGPGIEPSAPGKPWSKGQCRLCWAALHQKTRRQGDRETRRQNTESSSVSLSPPLPLSLSSPRRGRCIHLGSATGEKIECPPCSRKMNKPVHLKVFSCAVHGRCTQETSLNGVQGCADPCPSFEEDKETGRQGDKETEYRKSPVSLSPPLLVSLSSSRVRLDTSRLAPSPDRTWFNASLLRWQEKLLLAYRISHAGASLQLAELDEAYTPLRSIPLITRHPLCAAGSEDPRLFVHRGQLHLSFIGVEQLAPGKFRTNELIAPLDDRLRVERVIPLAYAQRQEWEKNWTFFSHSDELFAVYTIHPHTVLHLCGGEAHPFTQTRQPLRWSGGMLRGGASPVLVGEEFYCFFHGRLDAPDGRATYNLGVYTFEAQPPFRIRRLTPHPVMMPPPGFASCGKKRVIFCCGAILEGSTWKVSCGVHDKWIEIVEFDRAEIEKALVEVPS